MTQSGPLVRFEGAELSNRFKLQWQGISAEQHNKRRAQALVTSVSVECTGTWALSKIQELGSCTWEFTAATTAPMRRTERELRNMLAGR